MAEAKEVKLTKKDNAKKDVKETGTSRIGELKRFFGGTKAELKKVYWPGRQQVLVYTGVVLTTVFIMSVLIWVVDLGLSNLMNLLIGK